MKMVNTEYQEGLKAAIWHKPRLGMLQANVAMIAKRRKHPKNNTHTHHIHTSISTTAGSMPRNYNYITNKTMGGSAAHAAEESWFACSGHGGKEKLVCPHCAHHQGGAALPVQWRGTRLPVWQRRARLLRQLGEEMTLHSLGQMRNCQPGGKGGWHNSTLLGLTSDQAAALCLAINTEIWGRGSMPPHTHSLQIGKKREWVGWAPAGYAAQEPAAVQDPTVQKLVSPVSMGIRIS